VRPEPGTDAVGEDLDDAAVEGDDLAGAQADLEHLLIVADRDEGEASVFRRIRAGNPPP
jgi:hypothetical protein